MNLKRFLGLYDQFVGSEFSEPQLAMELGDMMIAKPMEIPEEREGRRVIAYTALKAGRFTYGNVHHGDIVLIDGELLHVLMSSDTKPKIKRQDRLYERREHFAVWLPQFELKDVLTAVRLKNSHYEEFVQVWAKRVHGLAVPV